VVVLVTDAIALVQKDYGGVPILVLLVMLFHIVLEMMWVWLEPAMLTQKINAQEQQ
jgi:hypothetical protein